MKIAIIKSKDYFNDIEYFHSGLCYAQNTKEEYYTNVAEYYDKNLKNEKTFLVVAKENEKIVSCALFKYEEMLNKYFIVNVNTNKNFQHKGIATKMLEKGIVFFQAQHFDDKIYLWVNKNNVVAIKLYTKLGFVPFNGFFTEVFDPSYAKKAKMSGELFFQKTLTITHKNTIEKHQRLC